MRLIYIVVSITVFVLLAALLWVNNDPKAPFIILILTFGALGGVFREYIGLRSRDLEKEKLKQQEISMICFSPLIGGFVALVFMSLLLSEIISGSIFPQFLHTESAFESAQSVLRGGINLATNSDFYKMIAWSLVAGYSEKFVLAKLNSIVSTK